MYALDGDEDIDELLPAARSLLDRLSIIVHAQELRSAGIRVGLAGSSLAVAGFGFLTFGRYEHYFRFGEEIYQVSPLLLIASLYVLFLLCIAYYRSSVDRLQTRITQRRLDMAISEAVGLDPSE